MKLEIYTEVLNGSITRNRKALKDALNQFDGVSIKITIEKKKRNRSNPQNRYYHGVIVTSWQQLLRDEWGEIYSKEETHQFLKMNFGCDEQVNYETGEVLRKPRSTTVNSTVEMEEFHEICRQKAFEMFGAIIPLPNEQIELSL